MTDSLYVTFRAGALEAALPQAAVAEILPLPELVAAPGAPRVLAGFVNLGGEAVAALALDRLLDAEGGEPAPALYRHLVRLRPLAGAPSVTLIVDRVGDAAARAQETQPVDEAESLGGCVAQTALIDGRLTPVLSPEHLLLAEEKARLDEFARRAQDRLAQWESTPA
ncbi:MAG: chemotaxis protein CheW [Caulobacter sp.]